MSVVFCLWPTGSVAPIAPGEDLRSERMASAWQACGTSPSPGGAPGGPVASRAPLRNADREWLSEPAGKNLLVGLRQRWASPPSLDVTIACRNGGRNGMTQEQAEMLMARKRPDWRVLEVIEVNDASGPSFETALARGGERCILLVSP